MNDTQVRIAVIGTGAMGRKHAELLYHMPRADLVAICDPDPGSEPFAQSLETSCFADYKTMIAEAGPEAVVIATPTQTHESIGSDCAAMRCHLLVEKPLAADLDSAQKLVNSAQTAGVHLLVGHHRRYNPQVEAVREIIQSGRLGKIIGVNVLWMVRKPDDYYDRVWRKTAGGGVFLTNLIHEIDSLRYCCGEIERIYAEGSSTARNFEVEDTGSVSLRFCSGALGTILVSDAVPSRWSYEQSTDENPFYFRTDGDCYLFFGSEASMGFPSFEIIDFPDPAKVGWQHPVQRSRLKFSTRDPLIIQLEHFCDVIRGKAKPKITGTDGLQTLRVVHGIMESARRARPVVFNATL